MNLIKWTCLLDNVLKMDVKIHKANWTLKNSVHFQCFIFSIKANFYKCFWNEKCQNQNRIIRAFCRLVRRHTNITNLTNWAAIVSLNHFPFDIIFHQNTYIFMLVCTHFSSSILNPLITFWVRGDRALILQMKGKNSENMKHFRILLNDFI